jgi:hypothetical protein
LSSINKIENDCLLGINGNNVYFALKIEFHFINCYNLMLALIVKMNENNHHTMEDGGQMD